MLDFLSLAGSPPSVFTMASCALLGPQCVGKNTLDPQGPSTSAVLSSVSRLLCGGEGGMVASKEPSGMGPEPHLLPAFVVITKLP